MLYSTKKIRQVPFNASVSGTIYCCASFSAPIQIREKKSKKSDYKKRDKREKVRRIEWRENERDFSVKLIENAGI